MSERVTELTKASNGTFEVAADTLVDVTSRSLDAAEDFYSDWKQFALRKNVFDVTVGIMLGTGLTAICTSLSEDILTPLIISSWAGNNIKDLFVVLKKGGQCYNDKQSCYNTVEEANNDGAVTLNYGSFIHSMISFLFMSLFLFLIYRALTRLRKSVELELKSQGIVSNGQLKKNGDNKGSTL